MTNSAAGSDGPLTTENLGFFVVSQAKKVHGWLSSREGKSSRRFQERQ